MRFIIIIINKFFCFCFSASRNGVISTIPITPTPLKNFPKLCEQRRKFSVLYKVEFQVRKERCFIFIYIVYFFIFCKMKSSQKNGTEGEGLKKGKFEERGRRDERIKRKKKEKKMRKTTCRENI